MKSKIYSVGVCAILGLLLFGTVAYGKYTITPVSGATGVCRWPSLNDDGDIVWCKQDNGYWHVYKKSGDLVTQITSGNNDHKFPVISNADDIVYVKYGVGAGVARQVIKHPDTVIEISSKDIYSAAHRDAGESCGISSNGTIISYFDWYPYGSFGGRRLNVSTLGRITNDFSPFGYPDINSSNMIVCAAGSDIYQFQASVYSPVQIAQGYLPRIADGADPEIIYLAMDGNITSTKGGVVDLGSWADVNNSGQIVFESGGQIFLAEPPLEAPTNLVVTPVSSTECILTWEDNSNNEDGFEVERETTSGVFAKIGQVTQNTITYTDNTFVADTEYIYRVRAYKGSNFSDYSNSLSAPTNLVANAYSMSECTLTWNHNSYNADGFEIQRKTVDGTFDVIGQLSPVYTLTYTDNTIVDGVEYIYRVRAYKGNEFSDYSNEAPYKIRHLVGFTVPGTAKLGEPYCIEFTIGSNLSYSTTTTVKVKQQRLTALYPWVQESNTVWKLSLRRWGIWDVIDDSYDIKNMEPISVTLLPNKTALYRLEGSHKWTWLPHCTIGDLSVMLGAAATHEWIEKCHAGLMVEGAYLIAELMIAQHKPISYNYQLSGIEIASIDGNTSVSIPPSKYVALVESALSTYSGGVFTASGIALLGVPPVAVACFTMEACSFGVAEDYKRAAADPPDFNYTNIAIPEIPLITGLSQVDDPELRYLCDIAIELAATTKAMLTSLERYEGAKVDGDDYYANLQYYTYHSYAERCHELSTLMAANIDPLLSQLPELTPENIQQGRQYLEQNGLPEIEVEILTRFGFSADDIAGIAAAQISLPDDFFLSDDYTLKDYWELIADSSGEYIQSLSEPNILNLPPVANAGSDQIVYAWIDGIAEVNLDGSGSNDFEGDELTYMWNWTIDGNAYDANSVNPTIELPVGQHVISLIVNDGTVDSEPNEVLITVVDNTPPSITAPADISISCVCPDGTQVDLGDPVVDDNADPDPVVTNNAPNVFPVGTTIVIWTVTDASGNTATTTQQITVVQPDTTPPSIVAPADITVETDTPDGTVVDIGNPVVSDDTDPNPVVTNDAPVLFPLGSTIVTWTATDTSGNSSTATQTVTVIELPVNQPPVANAGPDQTVYAGLNGIANVTLNGSGSSDPDGDMLTYQWSWSGGTDTGVSPTIELPVGVHTIQLVVNDGLADSAPDDVIVTVIAPVKGTLKITPTTINRKSNQPQIRASVKLPGSITKNDVDLSELLVLYPGEIKATSQKILPADTGSLELNEVVASFDKTALMNAVSADGNIELKVVGKLKSGQYFYSSETVRIIH